MRKPKTPGSELLIELRQYENYHIILWLLKDTFWVLDWRTGGMIMIVPTFLVAIYIAWRSRHSRSDLFHNMAICCWITANGFSMTACDLMPLFSLPWV